MIGRKGSDIALLKCNYPPNYGLIELPPILSTIVLNKALLSR
jgi:hypothetical protein